MIFDKRDFGRVPSCFVWYIARSVPPVYHFIARTWTLSAFITFWQNSSQVNFFLNNQAKEMLVEAQKSTLIDSCSFHPYKHAMDGRLPSLSLDITNPRFTNPFPGLDPRNLHHLPAALDPSGVPKDELFGPSRAHANQDVLQRLQNHSLAASAFTPTTPSVMRRDGSIKYQPSVPGFGYGDFPSSPVKPSTMGHLPQIPAGFSVATPLSVPRQMLPYGYSPMTMIPPGLGPAGYPPFMHMLSAASHILPFGYPTKKMFRCTDCRYMTESQEQSEEAHGHHAWRLRKSFGMLWYHL